MPVDNGETGRRKGKLVYGKEKKEPIVGQGVQERSAR